MGVMKFPSDWEFHHPNWLYHIFQRGWLKPPTRINGFVWKLGPFGPPKSQGFPGKFPAACSNTIWAMGQVVLWNYLTGGIDHPFYNQLFYHPLTSSLLAWTHSIIVSSNVVITRYCLMISWLWKCCLVGGLEHGFYFSIYWEFHHPN